MAFSGILTGLLASGSRGLTGPGEPWVCRKLKYTVREGVSVQGEGASMALRDPG